ncbi:MAG: hypothetical protein DMF89_01415 [Acidobacteria bacterium]|nr:MAG: hypothetical protein DMF89_01415 [Acidobacteriota bacterium]
MGRDEPALRANAQYRQQLHSRSEGRPQGHVRVADNPSVVCVVIDFIRRWFCWHDYKIRAEGGVMFLRCAACGDSTAGFAVNATSGNPVPSPVVQRQVAATSSDVPRRTTPAVAVVLHAGVEAADDHPRQREHDLVALRRYVASRGWTSVEHIEQKPRPAGDRPVLQQIVEQARSQQIKRVVCWRLDRLGCRAGELVQWLGDLTELGVDIVAVDEGLDTGTPEGKRVMQFAATLAAMERSQPAAVDSTPERSQRKVARSVQPVGQSHALPREFAVQFLDYLTESSEPGRGRVSSARARGRRVQSGGHLDQHPQGTLSRRSWPAGRRPNGAAGRGP